MAGTRGAITRSSGRKRRSVYLSNVFGIWTSGPRKRLHVTMLKGRQKLHTSLSPKDGLIYHALMMLYLHGLAEAAD